MSNFDQLDESEFIVNNSDFKIDIPKALGVAIIIILCLVVVSSIVTLPAYFWKDFYHVALPLSFLAGGVSAIFLLLIYLKIKWKTIIEHLKTSPNVWVIILSPMLFIFALPFAEFTTSLVPTAGNPILEQLYKSTIEAFEMMLNYKVAGFITVCILAPILEEILFRGILLRGMLHQGINPAIAIILSSILFGLAHMNPWQFIGAGILGAIFAYIYYRTKSLWICIFLHSLNNTISFILMLKFQSMEENVIDPNDYVSIFLCLFIAILIGFGIYKLTPNIKWN
ncbi:CPBP family intramembrane glutamic endopeptidase [Moheibacter sediminis]|uniref:CAAX prenyl protease 2/Lysostaphin resistance protein A-like domain-containing protein n=1 Tax=Moheibacter sediminis TaxID=1434700 RepID=A0A1W2CTX7_9FLAO|nr:type II CAAX endopeptidase family protein [Moheibacter sediminis]SMC88681.1 hypothetical protein SAMN06296427_11171 [Moheibacter sediminis]